MFPYTRIPRYLQELCGLYPFAQITEPVSAIRYLAEHFDLETLLQLKPRMQEFDGMEEKLVRLFSYLLCDHIYINGCTASPGLHFPSVKRMLKRKNIKRIAGDAPTTTAQEWN